MNARIDSGQPWRSHQARAREFWRISLAYRNPTLDWGGAAPRLWLWGGFGGPKKSWGAPDPQVLTKLERYTQNGHYPRF